MALTAAERSKRYRDAKRDGSVTRVTEERPITVTGVRAMNHVQLKRRIDAYPHDEWVGSPEHTELVHRLDTWPIEKLKAGGYTIPARREAG